MPKLASCLQIADFSGYASNFGPHRRCSYRSRAGTRARERRRHDQRLRGGEARRDRIRGLTYASSVAVHDLADAAAALGAEDAVGHPITLYGMDKLANEGTARVYWLEDGVPSVGQGAAVCNIPGQSVHMSEVIAAIEAAVPEARTITKTLRSRSPSNWQWESSRPRSRRSRRACARRSSCSTPAHSDTLGR
jgi:hypothetical protein